MTCRTISGRPYGRAWAPPGAPRRRRPTPPPPTPSPAIPPPPPPARAASAETPRSRAWQILYRDTMSKQSGHTGGVYWYTMSKQSGHTGAIYRYTMSKQSGRFAGVYRYTMSKQSGRSGARYYPPRHVLQRVLNPRCSSSTVSYDAASDVREALPRSGRPARGATAGAAAAGAGPAAKVPPPHHAIAITSLFARMTQCVKPLRHLATSSTQWSKWSVLMGRAGTKTD
jgi:hypothetical protein